MNANTWLAYLLAIVALSLSPGPNGLLALTHGALYGWRKATYTVCGGVFGFIIVIALAMAGVGVALQASVMLLVLMKWLGGAYLVWLGVQLWRSPPASVRRSVATIDPSGASMFRQGALSALTNPKVLLFFASFLPHFVDPARDLVTQFIVLAGTFAVLELATELVVAGAAQRINSWLARAGRRFNRVCGGLFITIGVGLPLRG